MMYGVGSVHDEAMRDHDEKLRILLQRWIDVGILINKD